MKFIRIALLAAVPLLFPSTIHSQQCDTQVVDSAGILKDLNGIDQAVAKLSKLGAVVRIVTTKFDGGNLDTFERGIEARCADWRSGNDGRNSSLIAFIQSTSNHHAGIYAGAAFSGVISAAVATDIRASSMYPAFSKGDFATGYIMALGDMTSRIQASRVHSSGPVVIHNDAPTDYSWVSNLLWGLFVMGIACLIWYALIRRSRSKKSVLQSDNRLKDAKYRASGLVNRLRTALAETRLTAVDTAKVGRLQSQFDSIVEDFNYLATSNASSETAIKNYDACSQSLMDLDIALRNVDKPEVIESIGVKPSSGSSFRSQAPAGSYKSYPEPRTSFHPDHVTERHTTIVNNNYDSGPAIIPIPIVIEEPVYRESERSYRQPEPEPVSVSSSSSYQSSSNDDDETSSGSSYTDDSSSNDDTSSSDTY